jgi:hypothetical protein
LEAPRCAFEHSSPNNDACSTLNIRKLGGDIFALIAQIVCYLALFEL